MWWTSWILDAEKFAYGVLNLLPEEFWHMTPAEFDDVKAGYYRRRWAWLEDSARFVCTMINYYPMRGRSARSIKPEEILGPSPDMIAQLERDRKQRRAQRRAQKEASEDD